MLDAQAAQILNVAHPGEAHLTGNRWFTAIGVMRSVLLDTALDSTVFISLPVGEQTFQLQPNPRRSTSAQTPARSFTSR